MEERGMQSRASGTPPTTCRQFCP
ncbi:unnamed protein product [Timema podura]|uniref:Uncharacterized protein n=1 Tax=Timema podura TaxID=61482 RepID=A0ABN7P7U3_TIMPD|nr:unnamed protein product [Timema podura]